jgi:hypothetical protein
MREDIPSLSNLFRRLAGRTRRALWPVPGMCALSELLRKGKATQWQKVRIGYGGGLAHRRWSWRSNGAGSRLVPHNRIVVQHIVDCRPIRQCLHLLPKAGDAIMDQATVIGEAFRCRTNWFLSNPNRGRASGGSWPRPARSVCCRSKPEAGRLPRPRQTTVGR